MKWRLIGLAITLVLACIFEEEGVFGELFSWTD